MSFLQSHKQGKGPCVDCIAEFIFGGNLPPKQKQKAIKKILIMYYGKLDISCGETELKIASNGGLVE